VSRSRVLEYVTDEEPGIRRKRSGRGFAYVYPDGKPVRSSAELARIRALAVPPAWTDVWIARRPDAHLQATGRDARGRKQYRYHPEWRTQRDEAKFERLLDFAGALPKIRRRVRRDLREKDVTHDFVVAVVVRLLETSLVRVGNEEYARDNASYGLTTLRDRHVRINGRHFDMVFAGKSGRVHTVSVHDPRLTRAVRRCRDVPGQVLFQYVDDDGRHPIRSNDVNTYLRETADADVSAKDYRTWIGTLLAASALATLAEPSSERDAARSINDVVCVVSAELGNTPAVCRASYVHPAVLDTFREGSLAERWDPSPPATPRGLIAEERRLLRLLRESSRSS
jgi:DNA topoisomerase-1